MQSASLFSPADDADAVPAPLIETRSASVGQEPSPRPFVGNVCHDLSPDETWDYFQVQGSAARERIFGGN